MLKLVPDENGPPDDDPPPQRPSAMARVSSVVNWISDGIALGIAVDETTPAWAKAVPVILRIIARLLAS